MIPNDLTIERTESPVSRFSLLDDMYVEKGEIGDWRQLHSLHYKAETLPCAPRFWRCITNDGQLVGVTVLSSVSLLHGARHEIFPKLKPGNDTNFTNVQRARFINDNFCRASRIVTDTLFRGVGVSYRMVNLSMRMENMKYCEIISSMAKFNPFDVKAGFRHANLRHAQAYQKGISFFRRYFENHPADHQAIMEELEGMPASVRKGTEKAMRKFYYKNSAREKTGSNLNSGTGKVDRMPIAVVLKELQQLIFASPAYGIWQNPDLGRELPGRLPLRAFDLQKPTEPLRLDLL